MDGTEQFYINAHDFGYSKSPEEALKIWNHDKILGEVVWVIRRFRPDIARSPLLAKAVMDTILHRPFLPAKL